MDRAARRDEGEHGERRRGLSPRELREARRLIRRWRRRVGGAAMLALSACGPRDAHYELTPIGPEVSISPASPIFAGASYVALVRPPDRSESGPQILMETRDPSCRVALERWEQTRSHVAELTGAIESLDRRIERAEDEETRAVIQAERDRYAAELAEASGDQRCPDAVGDAIARLPSGNNVVLLQGDAVRVLSSMSDLAPIESAEEAIVGLWLEGRSVRLAESQARRVSGGFEVTASASESETLGGPDEDDECRVPVVRREYREVLFVSTDGAVRSVDRELRSQSVGSEDVCHTYGRRTDGARSRPAARTLAAFLQRAADEEAEAIVAFERLAAELRHHGASAGLVDAARAAADDERRHVAMVVALGASLGSPIHAEAPRRPLPTRDLEAVLLENAVEGCVHETYAAAVALHQARHAAHPAIRRHFRRVAADEVGHAALAHAVHDELSPRLSPAARARVAQGLRTARRRLRESRDPEALPELGLPGARFRAAFLDHLEVAA